MTIDVPPRDIPPRSASLLSEFVEPVKNIDVKWLSDWMTLGLKVMTGAGALLLVAYAAKEHFIYDLSSLGAIALLLLVACAFVGLVAVASAYAFISFIWIGWLLFHAGRMISCLRGKPVKMRLRPAVDKWYIKTFSFLMFALFFVRIYTSSHIENYFILNWLVLTGFSITCFLITEPIEEVSAGTGNRRPMLLLVPTLPIMLLVLGQGTFSFLLDRAMIQLNFRSEPNQLISLKEQSYRQVSALADVAGIPISSCRTGQNVWLMRGAILVWHGIGATAYLRLLSDAHPSLLIPLPSSDVDAIREDPPNVLPGCSPTASKSG